MQDLVTNVFTFVKFLFFSCSSLTADRQKVLVHHPDKKSEGQSEEGDDHFKCIKIGQ